MSLRTFDMNEFEGQACVKYATPQLALSLANPATAEILQAMLDNPPTLAFQPIIDIKYWPLLKKGEFPGVPDFHFDIWNDPVKGYCERHRIFIQGADCQTEFETLSGYENSRFSLDEGVIFDYTGACLHRLTAAKATGPRVLIRCSWTALRAKNIRTNYSAPITK